MPKIHILKNIARKKTSKVGLQGVAGLQVSGCEWKVSEV